MFSSIDRAKAIRRRQKLKASTVDSRVSKLARTLLTAVVGLVLTAPTYAATPTNNLAPDNLQVGSSQPLQFEVNIGQHGDGIDAVAISVGNRISLAGDRLQIEVAESPLSRMKRVVQRQMSTNGGPVSPRNSAKSVDQLAVEALANPTKSRALQREPAKVDRVLIEAIGANADAAATGESLLPSKSHYLKSNGLAVQTDIPNFARVRYVNVYPNVDKVYYSVDSKVEYDWIVHPGADPTQILQRIVGGSQIVQEKNGDLTVNTVNSSLTLKAPNAYQLLAGIRQPVPIQYLVTGNVVAFRVGNFDPTNDLIIDPVLDWVNGTNYYFANPYYYYGPATPGPLGGVGADGSIYLIANFLDSATATLNTTSIPSWGSQIIKLDPTANSVQYTTNILGVHLDALAIDVAGNVFIAGQEATSFGIGASGFPVVFNQAYVAKISPTGNALAFSQTFPGAQASAASPAVSPASFANVILDNIGNAYFAANYNLIAPDGSANSPPQAATTLGVAGGTAGLFIAKIAGTSGTVTWSANYSAPGANESYVCNTGTCEFLVPGLAVDSKGSVYALGVMSSNTAIFPFPRVNAPVAADPVWTTSTGALIPGALLTANASFHAPGVPYRYSNYVLKIDPTGSFIQYATPVYGSASADGVKNPLTLLQTTDANAIAVDPSDNLITVGSFVSKFDTNGNLLRSIYAMGDGCGPTDGLAQCSQSPTYVAVDHLGRPIVAGWSFYRAAPFNVEPAVAYAGLLSGWASLGSACTVLGNICLPMIESGYVRRFAADWNSEDYYFHLGFDTLAQEAVVGVAQGSSWSVLTGIGIDSQGSVIASYGAWGPMFSPTIGVSIPPDISNHGCGSCLVRISETPHLGIAPNPSIVGQSVSLSVTAPDATWTGAYTISGGGITFSAVNLVAGFAAVTSTTLPAGADLITAGYSGDSSHAASSVTGTANVLNSNGGATIAWVALPSQSVNETQSVSIVATVTGTSLTGQVALYSGVNLVSQLPLATGGTATFPLGLLAPGVHDYYVKYTGDTNNAPVTASGTIGVAPVSPAINSSTCPSSTLTLG